MTLGFSILWFWIELKNDMSSDETGYELTTQLLLTRQSQNEAAIISLSIVTLVASQFIVSFSEYNFINYID